MKLIDRFLSLFRPASAAKPRLVSARTTDAAPRTVSLRHRASMTHGRFYTVDSARTRDTILSAEATKNYRLDPGATWEGDLRPERECPLRVNPSLLGAELEFAAAFNAKSREFWANGADEPTADTAAHTVDRIAAAAHARAATNATSVRDQADHMNAANKSFWGSAA